MNNQQLSRNSSHAILQLCHDLRRPGHSQTRPLSYRAGPFPQLRHQSGPLPLHPAGPAPPGTALHHPQLHPQRPAGMDPQRQKQGQPRSSIISPQTRRGKDDETGPGHQLPADRKPGRGSAGGGNDPG